MSDFETHVRSAIRWYLLIPLCAVVLYIFGEITASIFLTAIVCIPVTILGASTPDLDHHSSIPYRSAVRWGPYLLGAMVAEITVGNRAQIVTLYRLGVESQTAWFVAGLTCACAVSATVRGTAWLIPRLRPRHRGPLHRLPSGIVGSILCTGLAMIWFPTALLPTLAHQILFASAYILGFLSHLSQDGLLRVRRTYLTIQ